MFKTYKIKYNALQTLAYTGISTAYASVVASIPTDSLQILISSTLTTSAGSADLIISLDGGVTDHILWPAPGHAFPIPIDLGTEQGNSEYVGKAIQVKLAASATLTGGSVGISLIQRA